MSQKSLRITTDHRIAHIDTQVRNAVESENLVSTESADRQTKSEQRQRDTQI